MRGSSRWQSQRSATVTILIINVVVFIAHHALEYYNLFDVSRWFALSLSGLSNGFVWQLLSFQFLHANLLHILFNSWGIYVFGRAIEEALGQRKFLTLYFTSGAIGGLLHVIGTWALPDHFGGYGAAVVGASAGLFGLLAAFGMLFPHERLTMLLFLILPVSITGRVLMIISGLIAFVGILIPTQGGVAEGAHLGGLLAGMAYIHWFRNSEFSFDAPGWLSKFKRSRQPKLQRSGPLQKKPGNEFEEFTPDFISKEVDPILDKISEHGIQSLTERERRILEAARARMAKR